MTPRGLGAGDRDADLTLAQVDRVRLRLPGQHHGRQAGRDGARRATCSTATPVRESRSSSSSTRQGGGPFTLPYAEIATINFTGKDTAAGNSWKAWVERREREKTGAGRRPVRRLVRPILICTAVELEAQALARALELPPLPSLPFPAFGAGHVRVAVIGLRAGLLRARWPALLAGLARPSGRSRPGSAAASILALAPGISSCPTVSSVPRASSPDVTSSHHRAAAALAPSASTGRLVTTREVDRDAGSQGRPLRASGAVAADMESSVILARAAAAGLPSLVVRAVSDAARRRPSARADPAGHAGRAAPSGRRRGPHRPIPPSCRAPSSSAAPRDARSARWLSCSPPSPPGRNPRMSRAGGADGRPRHRRHRLRRREPRSRAHRRRRIACGSSPARAAIGARSRAAPSTSRRATCSTSTPSAPPSRARARLSCRRRLPALGARSPRALPRQCRRHPPRARGRRDGRASSASSTRRPSAPWAFPRTARRATSGRPSRSRTWWDRTRPPSSWPSASPTSSPRAGRPWSP